MLFSASDYVVHSLEAFLNLLHKPSFALKTLLLIVAKFVKQTQHPVFHQLLDLSLLGLSLQSVLLHLSLYLLQNLLNHLICFCRLVGPRVGIFKFGFFGQADYLQVCIALFFQPRHHVLLYPYQHFLEMLALPLLFCGHDFVFALLVSHLVSEVCHLSLLVDK
jgi:hypothetical protein